VRVADDRVSRLAALVRDVAAEASAALGATGSP